MMASMSTTQFYLMFITTILLVLSGNVSSEGDEATTASPANQDEKMNCYQCNATDTCEVEQNKDNNSFTDCGEKHCWTWKTEDGDDVTYRRDCGDVCTDDTKELDCKTSNNRTECGKCCSDAYCNSGLLNAGFRLAANVSLFLAILPILAVHLL
ncbi:uncharacterized protein LOC120337996 [Styela clava]